MVNLEINDLYFGDGSTRRLKRYFVTKKQKVYKKCIVAQMMQIIYAKIKMEIKVLNYE